MLLLQVGDRAAVRNHNHRLNVHVNMITPKLFVYSRTSHNDERERAHPCSSSDLFGSFLLACCLTATIFASVSLATNSFCLFSMNSLCLCACPRNVHANQAGAASLAHTEYWRHWCHTSVVSIPPRRFIQRCRPYARTYAQGAELRLTSAS